MKLRQIGVVIFLLATMVGCIGDEEPTPQAYLIWGFYSQVGEDHLVTTDYFQKLKIDDPDDLEGLDDLNNGDRIFANCYINESNENTTAYNSLVEIRKHIVVELSDIVTLDDNSRDTIGNGYVQIGDNSSITGDFLNLEIGYRFNEKEHVFSLCYDETIQVEGEPVIFELRNYAIDEDYDGDTLTGKYHSYDLQELKSLGELNADNYIEFKVRINSDDSQEADLTFYYNPQ